MSNKKQRVEYLLTTPVNYDARTKLLKLLPTHLLIPLDQAIKRKVTIKSSKKSPNGTLWLNKKTKLTGKSNNNKKQPIKKNTKLLKHARKSPKSSTSKKLAKNKNKKLKTLGNSGPKLITKNKAAASKSSKDTKRSSATKSTKANYGIKKKLPAKMPKAKKIISNSKNAPKSNQDSSSQTYKHLREEDKKTKCNPKKLLTQKATKPAMKSPVVKSERKGDQIKGKLASKVSKKIKTPLGKKLKTLSKFIEEIDDTMKLHAFKDIEPYRPKYKHFVESVEKPKLWDNTVNLRCLTPEIASSGPAASSHDNPMGQQGLVTLSPNIKLEPLKNENATKNSSGKKFGSSSVNVPAIKIQSPALELPDIMGKKVNLTKIFCGKSTSAGDHPLPLKSQFGWVWHGEPYYGYVLTENSSKPHLRICYPSIRHVTEGEIIKIKDDVLIRAASLTPDASSKSGAHFAALTPHVKNEGGSSAAGIHKNPTATTTPYIGKIMGFWNHNGEMVMTILWYYQKDHVQILSLSALEDTFHLPSSSLLQKESHAPRQTLADLKKHPDYENSKKLDTLFPFAAYGSPRELFASRHIDTLSVGCIEDKAYVFPYDQFCRLEADFSFILGPRLPSARIIAPRVDKQPTCDNFPSLSTHRKANRNSSYKGHPFNELFQKRDNVFFCSRIYDPIYKRIIKNPIFRYA